MESGEARVREAFGQQAVACENLGSPFNAALCRLLAERLDESNAIGKAVLNWPGDPSNKADSVPLRLAGALYALVLEGLDDELGEVYPPRAFEAERVWTAVCEAFAGHESFILERLKSAPQTNEVRRSAMIMPGFLEIARLTGKPLVISELGASAGLNLNWDRYSYRIGDFERGSSASAVHLEPEFEGLALQAAELTVAERRGCDLNPLDPTDPVEQVRMLSYIWPDQADRLDRTRAAFEIASADKPDVDRMDAVEWLRERLEQPRDGQAHVIYSTVAWQYLPEAARSEGALLMEMAGMQASEDAPLAWLQMEADGSQGSAALTLRLWPTGEARELGRADFHGRWLKWQGWGG